MGQEILLQKNYLGGEKIKTIYFGGGTPSLLKGVEIALLLERIHRTHHVDADAEITLEANPDDLTFSYLCELKSLGINRLSIGVQTFDDDLLVYLNRLHTAATAIDSVANARNAGFENISIDLIYAIPGLSNDSWKQHIAKALELKPEHISAYSLTIEDKTAFGSWLARGKIKPIDETLAAGQLEILMASLREAGYLQYEISNFARPSFESRHNSSYWKGEKYLGIGPSAHSYNLVSRQSNMNNNHLYVQSMTEGRIPFREEVLRKEDHINEYILTTLRTNKGCNVEKLRDEFGYDILLKHAGYLKGLREHNLITIENEFLILTEPGRLVADKITSDLFLTD
jgi:oxygen-independent coproporphyrinogen-3 oxidase